MIRLWTLLLLPLLLLTLVACEEAQDEPSDDEATEAVTLAIDGTPLTSNPSTFVLRQDILPRETAPFSLMEDSVTYEEQDNVLTLRGVYMHQTSPATVTVNLQVFRNPADAQRTYDNQATTWNEDNNTNVRRIDGISNTLALLLNQNQSAIALVGTDAIVQIDATAGTHTDLDMLHLLQIGSQIVQRRDVSFAANAGNLAESTLAPPPATTSTPVTPGP
jgi:hypothetical protein